MITLNTVAEIKAFQRKYKLVVDGIAGPQTRRALAEVNRPVSQLARKEPVKAAIKKPLQSQFVTAKKNVEDAERALGPTVCEAIKAAVMALPLETARFIDEIIAHCAATPEGRHFDVRDVTAWHKQRGWRGCGYHFVLQLDGTIQVGCPIGQEGIHTKGHNKNTVSASYIGGLSADGKVAKDTRTPQQIVALYYLCVRLKSHFKITKPVAGHNQYAQKACPSFYVPKDALGQI